MNAAKYLLAKYVPDLQRMEPRNIGVILWTPHGIAARFLAENPDRPGEVDAAMIPAFVVSENAYKQWIAFWRGEVSKPAIEPLRGGTRVLRTSLAFLDVLAEMSKAEFALVLGGTYLDAIREADITPEASRLFARLVA